MTGLSCNRRERPGVICGESVRMGLADLLFAPSNHTLIDVIGQLIPLAE
jgi:hypothetical protein